MIIIIFFFRISIPALLLPPQNPIFLLKNRFPDLLNKNKMLKYTQVVTKMFRILP
jgi:hypothetical protein